MFAEKDVTPRTVFILFVILLAFLNITVLIAQNNGASDSVYWTLCALTWSNCDVDVVYSAEIKVLSIINGITTIAIILVMLYSFSEYILEIDFNELRRKSKMQSMKNHFIICGYGKFGRKVCENLASAGVKFIVVDKNPSLMKMLENKPFTGIVGDVSSNPDMLKEAGISKAKGIVAALGCDADNIAVVLSSKDLNPDLMIASRAHSDLAVRRLKKAGASIIVMPEAVGGFEMSRQILKGL